MLREQRLGPPMHLLHTVSAEAQQAVKTMLTFSEKQRPRSADVLQLDWFAADHADKVMHKGAARQRAMSEHVSRLASQNLNWRGWQRAMVIKEATQLPAAKLRQLEQTFREMNVSHTDIGIADLKRALEISGMEPAQAGEAAALLFETHDADHNGKLSWTEFVAAMLPADGELFSLSLRMAFQRFDANLDGMLERKEVKLVLESGEVELGTLTPGKRKIERILDDLFPNVQDKLHYEDFEEYFTDGGQGR